MDDRYRAASAGSLDKKITLYVATGTETAIGGRSPGTPTVLATPWAQVRPTRGDETWHAHHLQGKQGFLVTVRYESALSSLSNADTWVWYNSRAFKVLAVRDPDERNERLELLCTEVIGWVPPALQ